MSQHPNKRVVPLSLFLHFIVQSLKKGKTNGDQPEAQREDSPVKAESSCCFPLLHQDTRTFSSRWGCTWLHFRCLSQRLNSHSRETEKAKVYTHISNWSFQDCLTVAWANLHCDVSGLKPGRHKGRKWQWCSAGSTKSHTAASDLLCEARQRSW